MPGDTRKNRGDRKISKSSVAHIGEVYGTNHPPLIEIRVMGVGLRKEFFSGSRTWITECRVLVSIKPTEGFQRSNSHGKGKTRGKKIVAPGCPQQGSQADPRRYHGGSKRMRRTIVGEAGMKEHNETQRRSPWVSTPPIPVEVLVGVLKLGKTIHWTFLFF